MFRIWKNKNLDRKNLIGLAAGGVIFLASLVLLVRESRKPFSEVSKPSPEVEGVVAEEALDGKVMSSDDDDFPESHPVEVKKQDDEPTEVGGTPNSSDEGDESSDEEESGEAGNQEDEALDEEPEEQEEKEISVQLKINNGEQTRTFDLEVSGESTVFDCLEKASRENDFSFDYTEYSFGIFVEELLGVRSDKEQGKYWIYYVNGKSADRGADSFEVNDGDEIYWEYKKVS